MPPKHSVGCSATLVDARLTNLNNCDGNSSAAGTRDICEKLDLPEAMESRRDLHHTAR